MKIVLGFMIAGLSLRATNVFTNPSFETQTIAAASFSSLNAGSTFITGWTVTGTGVLVISNGFTNSLPLTFNSQAGNQHLDLTGPGDQLTGGIEQTVSLSIGVPYTLTFWVGNQDNAHPIYPVASSVEVFINGVSQGIFTNNVNSAATVNWQQYSHTFTPAVASNTVRFRDATTGDSYAGLDNVSLDTAVPEPASWGMVLLALAAVAWRKSA